MKRLRDTRGSSPLLRKAQALLETAAPLPDSRDRMLRVRSALDQPRRRGGPLRVPALAAAAAVALFGASAFAAVRIYEALERPVAAKRASAADQAAAEVRRARSARKPAQPKVGEPAAADPGLELAKAVQSARAAGERVQRPAAHDVRMAADLDRTSGRTRARSDRAQARRAGADDALKDERNAPAAEPMEAAQSPEAAASDSELVHRALKALRRDRDPALAARLLREHRARGPRGPLAEEALSLQIEAALALRSPEAATLAREYLARYPGGRYAGVARRALPEAPP